jgi:hypothetical protein
VRLLQVDTTQQGSGGSVDRSPGEACGSCSQKGEAWSAHDGSCWRLAFHQPTHAPRGTGRVRRTHQLVVEGARPDVPRHNQAELLCCGAEARRRVAGCQLVQAATQRAANAAKQRAGGTVNMPAPTERCSPSCGPTCFLRLIRVHRLRCKVGGGHFTVVCTSQLVIHPSL